ncbi:MAG TPA: hypothetical protein VN577_19285 [Terriglobales bacterium]|nr:hypothetical protein [Terriglobales bacterium]
MKTVGKILLGVIAYGISMVVSGALMTALHLPMLRPIPGETRSPETQFLLMMLCTPVLIVGLIPLVQGLRGTWVQRCLAIAALMFVTLGLNTIIELTIFSDLLPDGNLLVSAFFILPALITAAVISYGKGRTEEPTFAHFGIGGWSWRLVLAWMSFPVIYFLFGMCVGPFVAPHYMAGVAGLKIPPVDVIIKTQLVRSLFFLAASFPAVLLWTKSRGKFIMAMGLAHAVMVGIFPLMQAGFLPMLLRVLHSIEITADSFAYAAVLGLLFFRAKKAEVLEVAKSTAA